MTVLHLQPDHNLSLLSNSQEQQGHKLYIKLSGTDNYSLRVCLKTADHRRSASV